MAVDRVEKRLRKVTAALDATGVKYAVIGGNAVAAWVARVDPSATRSTKNVDLLCDRKDAGQLAQAMDSIGFHRRDVMGVSMFIDPEEPSARSAVHIIWANERVRSEYLEPAPRVGESVRDPQGFSVLDLPALVRMKLTSNRDIDRVHVRDLLSLNLIDNLVRKSLPTPLKSVLADIESKRED